MLRCFSGGLFFYVGLLPGAELFQLMPQLADELAHRLGADALPTGRLQQAGAEPHLRVLLQAGRLEAPGLNKLVESLHHAALLSLV